VPSIFADEPIIIPIAKPGTAGNITRDTIVEKGHVVVLDPEAATEENRAGDITDFAGITDTATNQAPTIVPDQPGVYQVVISVEDADGTIESQTRAVIVDDGSFIIEAGYILRATDFDIGLKDVDVDQPMQQIGEQSNLQAWKLDGTPATAAVVSTDGYRNVEGTYRPVVGVYSNSTPALVRGIEATVFDNRVYYRVTFDANGGTLTGPRVITVVEPQTHLPYLPASPVRDGYSFRYWATGTDGATQFTADVALVGDITLYAIWTALPDAPVYVSQPPQTVIVNNPPASGNTTYVTVEPGAQTEEVTLGDGATPLSDGSTIGNGTTPSDGSDGPRTGWSLFDLFATILALGLLIVFSIKFFVKRSRNGEYEEEPIDARVWNAMTPEERVRYEVQREADYQAWLLERRRQEARPQALLINPPVLLVAAAALLEALVILFLTQDYSLGYTIVDDYSVIFALVLFVQILTPMVAAIIRNSRQDSRGQTPRPPASPASGSPRLAAPGSPR
jgi:uncharacterized repeat protein (TIGR02543 family)